MNKQQTVSRRLPHGAVPPQFARAVSEHLFEDGFDYDEPETGFAGEQLANYLLAFQNEMAMD